MSKESIVFLSGLLIILIPHFGIPETWKIYLLTGLGVCLMIIGYSLRRLAYLRSLEESNQGERRADSFVEPVKDSS